MGRWGRQPHLRTEAAVLARGRESTSAGPASGLRKPAARVHAQGRRLLVLPS